LHGKTEDRNLGEAKREATKEISTKTYKTLLREVLKSLDRG